VLFSYAVFYVTLHNYNNSSNS